jgi:hypothetical protein
MTNGTAGSTLRDMDLGTPRQWKASGITQGRFRAMVASGELVQVRHGAYATAKAIEAAEDKARRHALDVRAVLAAGSACGAVASHQSAALVHYLPLLHEPAPGGVTLTRPNGVYHGRSTAGVKYFSAALPAEHVTTELGVPVTTVGRTVIDIARTLPFMDAVVIADRAVHTLRTSRAGLAEIIGSCKGWPGIGAARRVVDFSDGRTESPLESCARVVFNAHGLPAPDVQRMICVQAMGEYHEYRVDFCWEDYKTIAEADGLMKYDSGAAAIRERKRDRLLQDAGYELVHITWKELFAYPEHVVRRLRRAFTRSGR